MVNIKYMRKAQASFFDALLFFLILGIASTVLIVAVQKPSGIKEMHNDEAQGRYTEDAFSAVVQCTIYDVDYEEKEEYGGEIVVLKNRTVPYLLLFDLLARQKNNTVISSLENGIEEHVNHLLKNTNDEKYYYIFDVRYNGISVFDLRDSRISSSYQPETFTTAEGNFGGFRDLGNDATFRLMIWRV
ncbi:MAG: hypothetical protein QF682_12650 [Candidatus Thermoplasmatota archaeon]|jgi:hypothetical protein|nr:hypothetical protein [Candidatus Thermoplasmatota archaeon]